MSGKRLKVPVTDVGNMVKKGPLVPLKSFSRLDGPRLSLKYLFLSILFPLVKYFGLEFERNWFIHLSLNVISKQKFGLL